MLILSSNAQKLDWKIRHQRVSLELAMEIQQAPLREHFIKSKVME